MSIVTATLCVATAGTLGFLFCDAVRALQCWGPAEALEYLTSGLLSGGCFLVCLLALVVQVKRRGF